MSEAASELNWIPDWKAGVLILMDPSTSRAPLKRKLKSNGKFVVAVVIITCGFYCGPTMEKLQ